MTAHKNNPPPKRTTPVARRLSDSLAAVSRGLRRASELSGLSDLPLPAGERADGGVASAGETGEDSSGVRLRVAHGRGRRGQRAAEHNRCRGLCLAPVISHAEAVDFPGFIAALYQLDSELADLVERGCITKKGWYPLAWYRALYAALAASNGNVEARARSIGVESTRRDLEKGAMRILLKVVSPVFLIERAPSFFRAYFEQGRLVVETQGPGCLCLSFNGCTGFCAPIYQDILGGCEGALLAAGAKAVRITLIDGGGDGDEHAVVLARWR